MRGINVAMLLRHAWDTASSWKDLLDHPAYAARITLRFRPVWFESDEKTSSPRWNYALHIWDWRHSGAPHALFADGES